MLLFNPLSRQDIKEIFKFQNISCYCLTVIFRRERTCICISKHLMLLFNWFHPLVQNCISISKHLMLLFNESIPFKYASLLLFQNISCYCLTPVLLQDNVLLPIFQNISCYCLTAFNGRWARVISISKHLMLLFNRRTTVFRLFENDISKHLMLLFNLGSPYTFFIS